MNELIKKVIENNALQLITTLITVACLLVAAYITVRLAPLAQSQAIETAKVDAFIAGHNDDVSRNEFNQLNDSLRDIRSDVRDIHEEILGR